MISFPTTSIVSIPFVGFLLSFRNLFSILLFFSESLAHVQAFEGVVVLQPAWGLLWGWAFCLFALVYFVSPVAQDHRKQEEANEYFWNDFHQGLSFARQLVLLGMVDLALLHILPPVSTVEVLVSLLPRHFFGRHLRLSLLFLFIGLFRSSGSATAILLSHQVYLFLFEVFQILIGFADFDELLLKQFVDLLSFCFIFDAGDLFIGVRMILFSKSQVLFLDSSLAGGHLHIEQFERLFDISVGERQKKGRGSNHLMNRIRQLTLFIYIHETPQQETSKWKNNVRGHYARQTIIKIT